MFLFLSLGSRSLAQYEIPIDSVLKAIQVAPPSKEKIELHFKAWKYYDQNQDGDNALTQLSFALRLSNELNLAHELAMTYFRYGILYAHMTKGEVAIGYYNKALLVQDGLLHSERLTTYNKLGVIYMTFEEHENSLASFKLAIEEMDAAQEETGENYGYLHNNIGLSYTNLGYLDSAMIEHTKCKVVRTQLKDTFALGQTNMNIGTLFYELGDYDSSLYYSEVALEQRLSVKDSPISSHIEARINIGKTLLALKKYGRAEKLLVEAEKEAGSYRYHELRSRATRQLIRLYSEKGKYKKAYEYTQDYYQWKDSVFALDKREEIIRLTAAHEYDEKIMQDSIMDAQQAEMERINKAKEDELQAEKDRASRVIEIGLGLAVILMLGIIILVFRSLQSKKKSSAEIEKQRDIAQDRGEKLAEINQEITDSINYAKHIQSAIMPSDEALKNMLGEHFVFYKPKAIVAGDFYWVQKTGDEILFSAADCTGHGVPGALVSVVCSGALTRAVDEYSLSRPGEILDKASEIVVDSFSKNDQIVSDGMDLSLCSLNKEKMALSYAGANNPIYIVRKKIDQKLAENVVSNSTHFIEEIKGDKQPVGYTETRVPFETKELSLEKGDVVYSFTDGYPDQFGGEKGKKFKYSSLKKLLLEISHLPMSEQYQKLDQHLDNWMGELEQVDDVCIIGVRV